MSGAHSTRSVERGISRQWWGMCEVIGASVTVEVQAVICGGARHHGGNGHVAWLAAGITVATGDGVELLVRGQVLTTPPSGHYLICFEHTHN